LGRDARIASLERVFLLATRSPRGGKSRPATGRRARRTAEPLPQTGEFEDIAARAARLGVTPERVLQEYARIAFVDLRHIVEWDGAGGVHVKSSIELSADDLAAISEIVPGIDPAHPRVKFYDKKAALDAIARHLGMFPLPARRHEADVPDDEGEDPREFLTRELARIAAGAAAPQPDLVADPATSAEP
jgi:hypothetical protein